MKTVGIIFIFFSLSAAGIAVGENYISVLKSIKRAEAFLSTLLIGLENGRLSVLEMLKNASLSDDAETKAFADMLEANFKSSCGNMVKVKEAVLKSDFCKDKIAALSLLEAIEILGKCSAEEQVEKIKFCRESIRKRYDTAFIPYSQKAKLSRSSGILAGLLAAIILI